MYAFQSESALYSCLNVKEPLLETGTISEVERRIKENNKEEE